MKKLLLTLAVALTACLTGCGSTSVEPAAKEDQFVVGMECAYAPFNWTESTPTAYNHPIDGTSLYCDGYDVQMAKAIASSLGKVLVVKAIEWDGLIPALSSFSLYESVKSFLERSFPSSLFTAPIFSIAVSFCSA